VTVQPDALPVRPAALELRRITKRFGATVAVDDVSLTVEAGRVHALLGENGAGKTTLMRVAFGLTRADHGKIVVDGNPARIRSAADAIAAGIGMVHQHFTNVPAMTVAENVALGHRGRFDARAAAHRVRQIGERTGLVLDPSARVAELSVAAQQRLEIVKALGRDARLLILDEPTAVLAPADASALLRWLRGFADEGHSVVLITHKLHEALSVADDVTVLRHGRAVLNAPAADVDAGTLAAALLGEAPSTTASEADAGAAMGEVIAALEGVDATDSTGLTKLHAASLVVRAGEIVGIAAIEGAGQHELLRLLARRAAPKRGAVSVPANVAFVPEDRHRDALVLDFSPVENLALRGAGARRGIVRWKRLAAHAVGLISDFDVRGGRVDRPVSALSGGNQQKFVLARELDGDPKLVVAENPTRGLDIRATAEVHDRLRAAARAGAGVVVYSSDLDEVLAIATRVVVVQGASVRDVERDREAVGRAMLGVTQADARDSRI
jgi:simple sugar transport system ATP-binding protein